MRVVCVFKADPQIGTGHLMRVKGLLPYFADAELILCTDSLSPELYESCHEYARIIEASPEALCQVVSSLQPQLVLIDHYYLDRSFEAPLYDQALIAVIDDLFGPRTHQCHLLFDQSLLRLPEEYRPYVNQECEICTGARYSLVKPCFALPRKAVLPQRPLVLINFGGADPQGCCLNTARTVAKAGLTAQYDFVVLAGQVNPDYDTLQQEFGTQPGFEVLRSTQRMDLLLQRCHLAIGACGGSCLERICAGVPALNVEIADNQAGATRLFEHYKVGLPYQLTDLSSERRLSQALRDLACSAPAFIREGQRLLDGRGLERIANLIKSRLKLFAAV